MKCGNKCLKMYSVWFLKVAIWHCDCIYQDDKRPVLASLVLRWQLHGESKVICNTHLEKWGLQMVEWNGLLWGSVGAQAEELMCTASKDCQTMKNYWSCTVELKVAGLSEKSAFILEECLSKVNCAWVDQFQTQICINEVYILWTFTKTNWADSRVADIHTDNSIRIILTPMLQKVLNLMSVS